MFSFFVFCTQWYCLIKKIYFLSLSSELSSHYLFPLSHRRSSWCRSLSRSRLMCLSVGFTGVTWASNLSSQWCSFAVVPGLRNKFRGGVGLRRSEADLSLSPNVACDGTDPSLSRWRFVGLWWPMVGFCWFVVGLAMGQDVVVGGCVAVTVGFIGEWWLAVVAGGCAYRWLWSRLVLIVKK